jgi:hypothetical protein
MINRAVVRLDMGRFDSEPAGMTRNPPHNTMKVQLVEGVEEFELRYPELHGRVTTAGTTCFTSNN